MRSGGFGNYDDFALCSSWISWIGLKLLMPIMPTYLASFRFRERTGPVRLQKRF